MILYNQKKKKRRMSTRRKKKKKRRMMNKKEEVHPVFSSSWISSATEVNRKEDLEGAVNTFVSMGSGKRPTKQRALSSPRCMSIGRARGGAGALDMGREGMNDGYSK